MRLVKKYKILAKSEFAAYRVCSRVLNFKRPKWNLIKRNILKKVTSPYFLTNNFNVLINSGRWYKVNNYAIEKVKLKRSICSKYDLSFNSKKLKSKLIRVKLNENLIKLEFRLDVLVSKIFFSNTRYQSCVLINNKHILVNNLPTTGNYELKKGDFITFSKVINNELIFKRILNDYSFQSFLEVDYYTSEIIIIKNLVELSKEDIIFLITESYSTNLI
jgi:hypothetical protein